LRAEIPITVTSPTSEPRERTAPDSRRGWATQIPAAAQGGFPST